MKYQENPFSKQSKYLKLKEGSVRVRLFDFIDGWEVWEDEGTKRVPFRTREIMAIPAAKRGEAKHFYAYRVWNQDEGTTQVWSITQRSIIEPLSRLFNDPDWGNGKSLSEFDVVVSRKGEGLETEYSVTPKPKTPFTQKLVELNLIALFDNGDPFSTKIEGLEPIDLDKALGDSLSF